MSDNSVPFIDATRWEEETTMTQGIRRLPQGRWISLFESGDATLVRGTPEDFKRFFSYSIL